MMRADQLAADVSVRHEGQEVMVVKRPAPCPRYPGLVRIVIDDGRFRRTVRLAADQDVELL